MNNRYVDDFDVSMYKVFSGENPATMEEPERKSSAITMNPKSTSQKRVDDFDISLYQQYTPETHEHPYALQYAHLTPAEYERLSPSEKKELQEYSPLKGFAKGLAKGATAGATEHFETTKVKEHEVGAGFGEFIGAALPIGLTAKALSIPFKMAGLMNYGLGRIGLSAATGAGYSLEKQAIKGEGISAGQVAAEAGEFGILHGLFEGAPIAFKWLKSLKPSQQAEALIEGIIPKDLTPNQYKFYETEVVPEIQKSSQKQYQEMMQQAIVENDKEFEQIVANTRAKHEDDLYRQAQEKQLSEEDFNRAKEEYQNKLKQVAAEHEAKTAEIQKQNQMALQQYQADKKAFESMKQRQQTVETAIGEKFSPESVKSDREAGLANVEAIRANDAHDYNEVRKAYKLSEQLNGQVTVEQPNLVQELLTMRKNLEEVPKLSPPQEQMLSVVKAILDNTTLMNESRALIGLKPINNNILEQQAKSLRYFMDFNFEHGNTRGIFQPLVNQIENAIEFGATSLGNIEAVEANKTARSLYRQWAQDYDNKYIRPFRDTSNQDYSKLFYETADPDNFLVIKNILDRSNAGQQVSKMNLRAMVEKQLKPFGKLKAVEPKEMEEVFKKIRGVISPQEEEFISSQLKTIGEAKEPLQPKLKEEPRGEIPLFKGKRKVVPEISKVKIPKKTEAKTTPSMKAASKLMEITPEQAMKLADTPTGLKKLRENVPKQLFEKIGKDKLRQVLYKGKVEHKFTGSELYEILNESETYSLVEEILGEDLAADLYINAKEIGKNRLTVDRLKKAGMYATKLKLLVTLGIL